MSKIVDKVLVPMGEYQAFMAWRSSVAAESFTSREALTHKKGLAEIAKGDYISLTKLKNELGASRRQSSSQELVSIF